MSEPKPYRPSNGTEFAGFYDTWCALCEWDRANRESEGAEDGCQYLGDSMLYDTDDEGYPSVLVWDNGRPCCMAFIPEGDTLPMQDDRTGDLFA